MILPRPRLPILVTLATGGFDDITDGGIFGGGEVAGDDVAAFPSDPPSFLLIPAASCLPAVEIADLAFAPAYNIYVIHY